VPRATIRYFDIATNSLPASGYLARHLNTMVPTMRGNGHGGP
jgi:hypothetical protein